MPNYSTANRLSNSISAGSAVQLMACPVNNPPMTVTGTLPIRGNR
jgi:hypothetical protein